MKIYYLAIVFVLFAGCNEGGGGSSAPTTAHYESSVVVDIPLAPKEPDRHIEPAEDPVVPKRVTSRADTKTPPPPPAITH